ncbi:MAG: MarR family transcriptional regulator [Alphaproteobacteria bacterium]
MSLNLTHDDALALWHEVLVRSVRTGGPDLSQRQLAILLAVYLRPPPHTVRGLAALLDISKPAVTRALDTMSGLGLLKRKRDERDRRNVLVQRTPGGEAFLLRLGEMVTSAAAEVPPVILREAV